MFFDAGAEVALRSVADKGRLTSAIGAAKPSAAATKYGPALKLAGSILSESKLPNKEVAIISDFQKIGWNGAEGVRLPDGVTVTTLPVTDEAPVNVAVTPAVLQRTTVNDQGRVTVTAGATSTGAAVAALPIYARSRWTSNPDEDGCDRGRWIGVGDLRSICADVDLHPRHDQDP